MQIRITECGAYKLKKHQVNTWMRAIMKSAASRWHTRDMPRHFTRAGASRYGYEPRGIKYLRRKKRQGYSVLPLVRTGRTRRSARIARIDAKATSRQARAIVRMKLPRYAYYRRGRRGTGETVAGELKRTTPAERRAIARMIQRRFAARLNARVERRTIIVGEK